MVIPMQDGKTERFTSCGFLYNPDTQSVFLHLRDNHTAFHPDCWAFFGGQNEGPETKEACYQREMKEEIGFTVEPENIYYLRTYFYPKAKGNFNIFYSVSTQPREAFVLGEGADFAWIPLADLEHFNLAEYARNDLHFFIEHMIQHRDS